MNDGSKIKNSVRIGTNSFTIKEINFLCKVLYEKYNIIASPHSGGVGKKHILYIIVDSLPTSLSMKRYPFISELN